MTVYFMMYMKEYFRCCIALLSLVLDNLIGSLVSLTLVFIVIHFQEQLK